MKCDPRVGSSSFDPISGRGWERREIRKERPAALDQNNMRYFIDTEFIEAGPKKPIQLVSIGIAAQDGRTYYAISSEFDRRDADAWVKANVLDTLEDDVQRETLDEIKQGILNFIGDDRKPEFWAYFADYDWVVFCQIFGRMIQLPEHFPQYCLDIKQVCHDFGNPRLPKQKTSEHNALNDAIWNKEALEFLRGVQ